MNDILKLIISVVGSLGAGFVGSLFTMSQVDLWYATLVRPELAPPNWVFGPVWTTLYVLMGVAAFLVWRRGIHRKGARFALTVFVLQLIVNAAWSIVFFGMEAVGGALIVIALLWVLILLTMFLFSRISKLAALLLLPYLAWVSFASYLNYMIMVLN